MQSKIVLGTETEQKPIRNTSECTVKYRTLHAFRYLDKTATLGEDFLKHCVHRDKDFERSKRRPCANAAWFPEFAPHM